MALLNRGMKLDAISAAQLDPKRCKSCEIRLCDGTNTKSILNIPVADKRRFFKSAHPFLLFFFFFS